MGWFFHDPQLDRIELKVNRILKAQEYIMATLEDIQVQLAAAGEATDNIAADVQGLKDKLDAALADNQGKIDEAVAASLQEVSDGLAPVVAQLQGVAAATPEDAPVVEPDA